MQTTATPKNLRLDIPGTQTSNLKTAQEVQNNDVNPNKDLPLGYIEKQDDEIFSSTQFFPDHIHEPLRQEYY